jgi:hypothetical protein
MFLDMSSSSTLAAHDSAFQLRKGAQGRCGLELLAQPYGSYAAPLIIWSRCFANDEQRDALLTKVDERQLDVVFLGRLTMVFGGDALDEVADALVAEEEAERARELEKEAQRARDHLTVNLYTRVGKHGRHVLELRRRSSDDAEWSVWYDRAIERDRLCDWMRWQSSRFLAFLNHAAAHGSESLVRMLTNEMFVTERRVKKEGRGAGGSRPLRMWRGD